MTEKGCDNCYYTYFDERAYPCSLCIRGIERTVKWQPSRKTKADTPQTESYYTDATHFGKAKGESTSASTADTPQTQERSE